LQRYRAVLLLVLGFALVTSSLDAVNVIVPGTIASINVVANSPHLNSSPGFSAGVAVAKVALTLDERSPTLAPSSWLLLGALVVWRGKVRATWSKIGLEEDLFILFVKTKGADTRKDVLRCVSSGQKDRYQISRDMHLAWRAVDRHVHVMAAHGVLKEQTAYGKVRMYAITPLGEALLKTLHDTPSAS
jgi:predicted transcriptional regulator